MDADADERGRLCRDIGAIRTSLDHQAEAIAHLRTAVERQHELIERIVRLEERDSRHMDLLTTVHGRIDGVVGDVKDLREFQKHILGALPNLNLASAWVFRTVLAICGLMGATTVAIVFAQITGKL